MDWFEIGEIPPAAGTEQHRSWVLRGVLAILVMVLVSLWMLVAQGCTGCPTPPTPTPSPTTTPTPAPTPETFAALRLETKGSDFVYADGHAPYALRKVVFCCKDTQGTGWPGLSESAVITARNQGQATMVAWRVGPFRSCNEPEWAATGGGAYVEAPDGRADLTQFNEKYRDAIRARIEQAGKLGMNVEISIMDSWALKIKYYASNSDKPCWVPWKPEGNIQGQDHLTTAYHGTNPDPVQAAYVNWVFETTGPYGNVSYEAGTESDQLSGDPKSIVQWELTMEAMLRQAEAAHGWPRHIYATNYVGDASYGWLRNGRLQVQNAHKTTPQSAVGWFDPSDFVRPLVFDEANYPAAVDPQTMRAFACYAREHGAYWALWRGDQPQNYWLASLSLVAQDAGTGCPADLKDGCPYTVCPIANIGAKRHSGNLYDSTPHCSNGQPIRPEGDVSRGLCELVAAGGNPTFSLANPSGNILLVTKANPYQFLVAGTPGASANLKCTVPAQPGKDLCGGTKVSVQ